MATHPSIEANMKADTKHVPSGRVSELQRRSELPAPAHRAESLPFQAAPDIAPIAVIPQALANRQTRRKLRRVVTREEGRALEMIGHAVDYLNDCYLYEGDEKEIINIGGATMKALGILASARAQILEALPVAEPRTMRLWNALFHRSDGRSSGRGSHRRRDRESKPAAVVPLSSSR